MSLNASDLASLIKSKMDAIPAADAENPGDHNAGIEGLATAIVDYFLNNLEVKIPVAGVIKSVTGGSGAPAVGIANDTKISCEVS